MASMAHDLLAGKPIELDGLSGAVVRLGGQPMRLAHPHPRVRHPGARPLRRRQAGGSKTGPTRRRRPKRACGACACAEPDVIGRRRRQSQGPGQPPLRCGFRDDGWSTGDWLGQGRQVRYFASSRERRVAAATALRISSGRPSFSAISTCSAAWVVPLGEVTFWRSTSGRRRNGASARPSPAPSQRASFSDVWLNRP